MFRHSKSILLIEFISFHLIQMGMSDIFDAQKSNLSGLLESGASLSVSEAIHKAFIEVDEEGTEAAAVTGNIN